MKISAVFLFLKGSVLFCVLFAFLGLKLVVVYLLGVMRQGRANGGEGVLGTQLNLFFS